jgi:hypothetical protein
MNSTCASLAAGSWSDGERIDGVVQVSPAAGVLAMKESLFLLFFSLLGFGPVSFTRSPEFGLLPSDRHRTNQSDLLPSAVLSSTSEDLVPLRHRVEMPHRHTHKAMNDRANMQDTLDFGSMTDSRGRSTYSLYSYLNGVHVF